MSGLREYYRRRAAEYDRIYEKPERQADLRNLQRFVRENKEAIIAAICADYGNRSRHETQFADLLPVTDGINDILLAKNSGILSVAYLGGLGGCWCRPCCCRSSPGPCSRWRSGGSGEVDEGALAAGACSPWPASCRSAMMAP